MMTWIYLRSRRNLFVAGIFYHLTMNMMVVLFQTDVTFSNLNAFPEINRHYFVIYSLITLGFAIGITLYAKLYQPVEAVDPLTGAGNLQVPKP